MARVAVLGAGSWGTAFAKVLADAGSDVMLWARRAEVVDTIQRTRTNPGYLPDVVLPTSLHATGDPRVALAGADIVALAVPAQSLRVNLTAWAQVMPRTATVIACLDHDRAVTVQQACVTGYFRPYTNTDVVGCELAGAYKNVIALGCGMAVGVGLGDNSITSIITRGLAETARLGVALEAEAATFAGLAGMSRRGVEVPLADGVHRVCHDGLPTHALAAELLGRSTKPE